MTTYRWAKMQYSYTHPFSQLPDSPHEIQLAEKLLRCRQAGLLCCVGCVRAVAADCSAPQLQQPQQSGKRRRCHVRVITRLVRKAVRLISLCSVAHFCCLSQPRTTAKYEAKSQKHVRGASSCFSQLRRSATRPKADSQQPSCRCCMCQHEPRCNSSRATASG